MMDPIRLASRLVYQAAFALAMALPSKPRGKKYRAAFFARKIEENVQKLCPIGFAVLINGLLILLLGTIRNRPSREKESTAISLTVDTQGFFTDTPSNEPPAGGGGGSEAALKEMLTQMKPVQPTTAAPSLTPEILMATTTIAPSAISLPEVKPNPTKLKSLKNIRTPSAPTTHVAGTGNSTGTGNGTGNGNGTGTGDGTGSGSGIGNGNGTNVGNGYGPGMLQEADLTKLKVAYIVGIDPIKGEKVRKTVIRKAKSRHNGDKNVHKLREVPASTFNGLKRVVEQRFPAYIAELTHRDGIYRMGIGGADALPFVKDALQSSCDVVFFHTPLYGVHTYEGLIELDKMLTEAKKPLVIVSYKNLPPVELWEIINRHGGWIEFNNHRIESKESLEDMIKMEVGKPSKDNQGAYRVLHINEVEVAECIGIWYNLHITRRILPEEINIPIP